MAALTFATSETITVEAEGIGSTVEEAVQSSLRMAISTAVGSLFRSWSSLDTSLEYREDEIIEETVFKEKILSFANAYVKDYEILEHSENDGLFTVIIKAEIKLQALEGTMLRNAMGFKTLDGAKLLAIFEANEGTDVSGGEMVSSILKDFGFPKDCWSFTESQTEIVLTTANSVQIVLSVTLATDTEKFFGFSKQLEEILDRVCGKTIIETVYTTRMEDWDNVSLSDFISDSKYRNVIRFFQSTKDGQYTFKEYFLNTSNALEKEIYDAFKQYERDFDAYAMNVSMIDGLEKEIHVVKNLRVSSSSLLLNNSTLGFARTSQKANQFILFPGIIRIVPGKMRLSNSPLEFNIELEIPRNVFEETKKIKLELVNE